MYYVYYCIESSIIYIKAYYLYNIQKATLPSISSFSDYLLIYILQDDLLARN